MLGDRIYTRDVYFSSRLAYDPRRDKLWQVLCTYLQRDIPTSSKVLELGGGYSNFINHIQACEKHVIDICDNIQEFAGADVKAHLQSCTSLANFPAESFNVVFASNLFEHLTREELSATLSEVWRVLCTGGKIIIIQPNFKYAYKNYFDDYTHLQVFTHVSLQDLLASHGFVSERVVPRFLPFSLKARLPKWCWLLRVYLLSPWRPFADQMYIVAKKAEKIHRNDDAQNAI